MVRRSCACSNQCREVRELYKADLDEPTALGKSGDYDNTDHGHEEAKDTSWPVDMSKVKRYMVLNDFITVHRFTFKIAIGLLRHSLQKRAGRDLDPRLHDLAFTLGYRGNNDGNPAKR